MWRVRRIMRPLRCVLLVSLLFVSPCAAARIEVSRARVFDQPIRLLLGTAAQPRGVLLGDTIHWLDDEWQVYAQTDVAGEVWPSPGGEYYVVVEYAGPEHPSSAVLYRRPGERICPLAPHLSFRVADDGRTAFGIDAPPGTTRTDITLFRPPPEVLHRWRYAAARPGTVPIAFNLGASLFCADPDGNLQFFDAGRAVHLTVPDALPGSALSLGGAQLTQSGPDTVVVVAGYSQDGRRSSGILVMSPTGDILDRHELAGEWPSTFALAASRLADRILVATSRPAYALHSLSYSLVPQWSLPASALAPAEWAVDARHLALGVHDLSPEGLAIVGICRQDLPQMDQAEVLLLAAQGEVTARFRLPPVWLAGGLPLTAEFTDTDGSFNLGVGTTLASLRLFHG